MNSNKFSYQGQIETILHYLNSMIQKNWTGKTADEVQSFDVYTRIS